MSSITIGPAGLPMTTVAGVPPFHSGGTRGLYGRNAGYPAPPVQSRTCSFPASGSSVGLASAVQSRAFRQTLSDVFRRGAHASMLACLGRDLIDPPGSGLVQGLPAGAEQVGIQAPIPLPKPGVLVRSGFVGDAPQGGWRMGGRSDRVRQQVPVRAPSCRHVLPRVGGFPHRCVLCVLRHPRDMPRACHGAACRSCVPQRRGGARLVPCPGFPVRAARAGDHVAVSPGRSLWGFPRSATALFRPAAACGRRRTGLSLPQRIGLCGLRERSNPRRSLRAFSKRSQHFRVRGHPYGLQETRSTLRPSCAPCSHGSALDARRAPGGWLALPRPGLAPCQRCQASLGAITLGLSCCWKQSAARLCSARVGR
jgi:hypothetical protein